MMTALVEAALRSLALAFMVWFSLAAFRVGNPQQEKLVWAVVLAGALAMPALQRLSFAPTIPALSVPLPAVVLHDFSWHASSGPVTFGTYLYLTENRKNAT